MKTILRFTFAVSLMLSVYACSKGNADNSILSLTGKWKLVSVLADPGDGTGRFTQINPNAKDEYVQFNANGSMSSTLSPEYVRYAVKDSITITVYKTDNSLQYYRYKFHDGALDLSPDGPIRCYEPCAQRFIKVSN